MLSFEGKKLYPSSRASKECAKVGTPNWMYTGSNISLRLPEIITKTVVCQAVTPFV
ncbi:MAG TPA: hypothetical protein VEA59_06380 [Patescibacteria group bacterium]|nr:hypothetical protein [Patescibacteria group bacterium]